MNGDVRPAAALGVVGQAVMEQFAGVAIVASRGGPPAGYQQPVPGHDQRSLGRNAGEGIGLMRLFHPRRAIAVVGPDDRSGAGVDGMQEDAHERPDAGGKVNRGLAAQALWLGGHHGCAADRPGRDQTLIAQHQAVAGPPRIFQMSRPWSASRQ